MESAVGTEEVALLKIDRDLRLAEAMEADPAWLKFFAGSGDVADLERNAIEVFKKMERQQALGPRGVQAYAVFQALVEDAPLTAIDRSGEFQADGAADPELQRGSWWRARLLEAQEGGARPGDWKKFYRASLESLRWRAIGTSGVIGLLALAGLIFLPGTLRRLGNGLRERARGYGGAWTPALGLTIFMIGTLAWIGYIGTLNYGIEVVQGLPSTMAVLLDAAARLLPSLIAVGFLFKRPQHAIRVLGLNRALHPRMIAGMFALLLLADRLLRGFHIGIIDSDPGGGLSAADAGWNGLIFSVVSACIVAPFAEEIFYRGVLFRSLANRLGVLPGALISGAIFAIVHFYGLYGFLSVAIFGFSCALLYAATGSLVSVIVLHMLYNTMIKLPEWIFYHAKLDW